MFAKTFRISLILLIVNFLSFPYSFNIYAQTPPSPPSVFDYLTQQEGGNITLELDLTELINNKKTNQYFPGTLSMEAGQLFGVDLRPRGKYRRRICDVPPLKIKFRKKELFAAGLDTLNEIKLVVPCFDDPESEALVLREEWVALSAKFLGLEKGDTLAAMMQLAESYLDAGRTEEALTLLKQVLESRVRVFGPKHWATGSTVSTLANAYRQAGRPDEAANLPAVVEALSRKVQPTM